MNEELCVECEIHPYEIECPECGKPLCADCVQDLDGLARCEECKEKDLGRGEQYSCAVHRLLHNPRTSEWFSLDFWDMAKEELGNVAFMRDGLLHYRPSDQVFYLTDVDVDERLDNLLVPEINRLLRQLGKKPLDL